MDDQNKKQIVIIVVIIIALILVLLGLLIVAVITNKSTGGSLSNNSTMSVNTTTITQNISTTTVSTPSSGRVDENLVLQGIENYLIAIKTDGLIGEYNIGGIELRNVTDQTMLCPTVTYDSSKIYADVILSYVKIPDAPPLVVGEEVVDGRASINISFSLSFDGSAYIVEETFSC